MDIVDLKKFIYENNKVEDILLDLGCHSIKYNSYKNYFTCANPDGDNAVAVVIYNDDFLRCNNYTRNILNGDDISDLLTLITYYKKQTNIKHKLRNTVVYLHDFLNLKYDKRYKKKTELTHDPLAIFKKIKKESKVEVTELEVHGDEIFHDIIPLPHIDLIREGIMPWTCTRFNIGYSSRHKRHVFPHRYWAGDDNSYLGLIGRTAIEEYEFLDIAKYKPLGGYNFPKGMNLYGLNENYDTIQKAGYVVVVEGEKSVLRRHSRGDGTCVAAGCHTLTDEQVRILISLDVEIIIAWDKDISLEEIKNTCKRFHKIRPVSYLYDKWGILDETDSPCDLTDEVYKIMLQYKIKYE